MSPMSTPSASAAAIASNGTDSIMWWFTSSTTAASTAAELSSTTSESKLTREEFLLLGIPPTKRMRLLIGYALLLVLIVAANTAALVALTWRRRRRRRLGSELLVHLCAAGLLVGVAICGCNWVSAYTIEWVAGDVLCRLVQFAQALGIYATSYLILAISIDRCLAVLDPIGSAQTVRRRLMLSLAAWVFGAIFSSPQVCLSIGVKWYRKLRVAALIINC